jgi:hypothetical protein
MLWRLRSNQKWQKPGPKTTAKVCNSRLSFSSKIQSRTVGQLRLIHGSTATALGCNFGPRSCKLPRAFDHAKYGDSRIGSVLKKKATYNMGDQMAGGM